jgi:hypothetical protein
MEHLTKASKTNSKHPDLKQLAIKGWLILSNQQKKASLQKMKWRFNGVLN